MTEIRFDCDYIISHHVIETPFRKMVWMIKAQKSFSTI